MTTPINTVGELVAYMTTQELRRNSRVDLGYIIYHGGYVHTYNERVEISGEFIELFYTKTDSDTEILTAPCARNLGSAIDSGPAPWAISESNYTEYANILYANRQLVRYYNATGDIDTANDVAAYSDEIAAYLAQFAKAGA
jgi:hypothetical protein